MILNLFPVSVLSESTETDPLNYPEECTATLQMAEGVTLEDTYVIALNADKKAFAFAEINIDWDYSQLRFLYLANKAVATISSDNT